jgi:translation initiation factor 3 subunit D
MITVNETSLEYHDEKEQINSPLSLSHEATLINQQFPLQLLKKDAEPFSYNKPNPFKSDDMTPLAYRYRKWGLENGFDLVCRCEVDAIKRTASNTPYYITVRALNQYDPKTISDWRQKLDTQESAILASELKNNHSKLIKWAVQSILSGTDQVMIGYIVRTSMKDKNHHSILSVKTYNTLEFANLIGVKAENVFAIFDALTNSFMKLPEGRYLLAKDPNSKVCFCFCFCNRMMMTVMMM